MSHVAFIGVGLCRSVNELNWAAVRHWEFPKCDKVKSFAAFWEITDVHCWQVSDTSKHVREDATNQRTICNFCKAN